MDENQVAQTSTGSDLGSGINPYEVQTGSITEEQIAEANTTLQKYKEGKSAFEQKIVDNEEWYKVRHWPQIRDTEQDIEPASGWLFNAVANKHASAMDSFPSPNILPREQSDTEEAKKLTSIIPVLLDQMDFEQTYNDEQWHKQINGVGCYGVFWDRVSRNGLGDVMVKDIDLLNLFWQPGVTDIQDSRSMFCVSLEDEDLLEQMYPELEGKLGGSTIDVAKYTFDDNIDTTGKALVVDWYYKQIVDGQTILQYCKYIGSTPVFATEGNSEFPNGWYEDGKYPFVFDVLYPLAGLPTGFGTVDVGKSTQEYIDHMNQALAKNVLVSATPRFFIRDDGGVNEQEFADLTKDLVHTSGSLGQDSIMPIQSRSVDGSVITAIRDKVDELKETVGNRDVSSGGVSGGVTSGSAIAAMQEAGAKLDRDANKGAYRAYRKVIKMIIERIRQFYDDTRYFRIIGDNGETEFVGYSNANIRPQMQPGVMGVETGYRLPEFDVEVTAEKASPYSRMSNNELALQLYNAGVFNPELAQSAMMLLEMMDFDKKEKVMSMVQQAAAQYAAMQQSMMGMPMGGGAAPGMMGGTGVMPSQSTATGTDTPLMQRERERVANSTAP